MTEHHPRTSGAIASAVLTTAAAMLAGGAVEAVLASAREALRLAPKDARAHYVLGQCLLALKQPAQAEEAFAMAQTLEPNWIDARINRGLARYRQGDIQNAIKTMREALRRQPGLTEIIVNAPCFSRGTRILTDKGEIAIERLEIGDLVVTASEDKRPIRWIGRRAYDGRMIAGKPHVLPIRIYAGALSEGLPARDLYVSPEHALFIDGALIPTRHSSTAPRSCRSRLSSGSNISTSNSTPTTSFSPKLRMRNPSAIATTA
jgi:tetratricopeptide (TPR) repeat protein